MNNPGQHNWFKRQWEDISGNVKFWVLLTACSLLYSAVLATIHRLRLWPWQQIGLALAFLFLFVWAIIASIVALRKSRAKPQLAQPAQPVEPAQEQAHQWPLEVVGIDSTFIIPGNRCTWTESGHGFQSMIVTFKNQIATTPKKQNQSFYDVTANLTYKGTDRTEHIVYGNWLNEYTRAVDFKPGEVHRVVIAIFERAGKRMISLYNPKSTNPLKGRWRSGIQLHEAAIRPLPTPPCEVTVTLLSEQSTLFSDTYILTAIDNGTMELRRANDRKHFQ